MRRPTWPRMSVDSARFFDQLEKMKKFKNDLFDYTCFVIGLCLNKLKFVSLSEIYGWVRTLTRRPT
jgi:hypothetical protein